MRPPGTLNFRLDAMDRLHGLRPTKRFLVQWWGSDYKWVIIDRALVPDDWRQGVIAYNVANVANACNLIRRYIDDVDLL